MTKGSDVKHRLESKKRSRDRSTWFWKSCGTVGSARVRRMVPGAAILPLKQIIHLVTAYDFFRITWVTYEGNIRKGLALMRPELSNRVRGVLPQSVP